MCFACFHSPYCPYMSILLLECQLTHLWPTTIRCQLLSFVLLVIHLAQVQLNAETGRCNSSCRRFERSAEQTQSRSRPWRCCAIFGKPVQVSTNSTEQLFYILYIVDPLWKRQAFHVLKSWHRFFFESDMRYRVQHQAVAERVSSQTRVTALHFSIERFSTILVHFWRPTSLILFVDLKMCLVCPCMLCLETIFIIVYWFLTILSSCPSLGSEATGPGSENRAGFSALIWHH